MSTFVKKVTSAVAGLAIVFSMVTPIAGVSAAYSSLEAANKLATLGVIVDQSANPADYRLEDTTSREELSKIIAKLGGLNVVEGAASTYVDADFATWAEKYATALNEAGYAASNEFFNPKNLATKIEALKWVMEARDVETGTGDNWMAARVDGAVAAGIASSFSDYNADVSRGQVFIWAANAIEADDVVVEDDLLCEILGTCSDDEIEDETETPTTGGSLEVSLSPLSPTSGQVAAGKARTPILAIDVTAGSSDVELDEITLSYVGLSDDNDFSEIAVYMGNDQVTNGSKKFDSEKEAEISFENDTVIQAGKTVTLMVTANVAGGTDNVAHQVQLDELLASGDVMMDGTIKSVVFNVIDATNTATLDFDFDAETSEADLGETVTFADFSLEEEDDNEDVVVKSITFEFGGGVDAEDDIEDLVLMAEGVVIADDLMVNDDDEVIVDLEYVIAADDTVDFELEGVITGSVGDNLTVDVTEIFAIGADTEIIATIEQSNVAFVDTEVANFNVNGAEFNVSFDKSDVDEAKPDAEDVLVGTLEILADSDYTINELQIEVVSTGTGVINLINNLEVDGDSEESISSSASSVVAPTAATTTVYYNFGDLDVNSGVEEMLDVTFDVEDSVLLNGEKLTFTVSILEVEDEDEDETYTTTSTPVDIDDILSASSFSSKTIDVESASYELVQTTVTNRTVVIGNGVEVVLYKGKLSVGDASSVTFNDISFPATLSGSTNVAITAYELDDILQSATLNIGGVTEDGDIEDDRIDFNSTNIEVAADSDNVDFLVTAILKDNDTVSTGDKFFVTTDNTQIDAEDEDNEDVVATSAIVTNTSTDTLITLNDEGSLRVEVVQDGDFEDEIEDVVLAGTNSVILAEVELEAEDEDVDVNSLVFTLSGGVDASTTLKEVRLMDGATVLDTAVVTFTSASGTLITFEDFTVEDTGSDIVATLEADLEIITDEGGEATSTAGDLIVLLDATTIDAEGESSNNTINATGGSTAALAVNVTPVLVTAAIVDTLGDNDNFATVEFSVDFGSNDLDNDNLFLSLVTFEELLGTTALEIRNDDGDLVTASAADPSLTVTLDALSRVNDGDQFEFDTNSIDNEELRVIANGFDFVLDLDDDGTAANANGLVEAVKSQNDNTLNFGQYNVVN